MKELGISELTDEQIEELCLVAEEAARKHVLSVVPEKKIETINICADIDGLDPLSLTVDVDVVLSPQIKNVNVQELADGAVKKAFEATEKHLRELSCHIRK